MITQVYVTKLHSLSMLQKDVANKNGAGRQNYRLNRYEISHLERNFRRTEKEMVGIFKNIKFPYVITIH